MDEVVMAGAIVSVSNRKGGVGKTTTVVALAKALTALYGKNVVVVDTDPQGSASLALYGTDLKERESLFLENLLRSPRLDSRKRKVDDLVCGHVSPLINKPDVALALLPCSPGLWTLEGEVRTNPLLYGPRNALTNRRFKKLMDKLKSAYDVVLVDTAPGRGLFTEQVVRQSDLVIVPCGPTPMSVWGLNLFEDELQKIGALDRSRLLWSLYNPNSGWREFAKDHKTALQYLLPLTSEHLATYQALTNGPTDQAIQSFSQAFPGKVGPMLTEIADAVIKLLPENRL